MEKYNFSADNLERGEYVPLNGECFPFAWQNWREFSVKWNSTIFPETKPTHFITQYGTSVMTEGCSDIPIKTEKRGIPLKVILFSEKFQVKKIVPFDFRPEQEGFPHKRKALLVNMTSLATSLPVSKWLWRPTGEREVMCSISVGDFDFFLCTRP